MYSSDFLQEATPETIENLTGNVYSNSGYIFTKSGEVYSPSDFHHVWDMYGENVYYTIHWEGDDIATEYGEAIKSVY